MDELQAAARSGRGRSIAAYDELLDGQGVQTAQVLLTFGDMRARTNYLNARQTLQQLLEWHVVPVINENDTTATDEITFGDNDFLAAQVAILRAAPPPGAGQRHRRALHGRPAQRRLGRRRCTEVDDFSELDGLEIGDRATAIGSGGMRSKVVAAEMATAGGIPVVVCSGKKDGAIARAAAGDESEGTHFTPHEQPRQQLQAVAALRQGVLRHDRDRRRRRARAARPGHQPAAGRHRRRQRRVRGRRRRRDRRRRRRARGRPRASSTTAPRSCADQGHEARTRCRS